MTRAAARGCDSDVVVVGGGPAGSATAFFLACAGLKVTLLDRAIFPRDKPCAEYLSPQASRILAAMGVEKAAENAGAVKLRGMSVRAPNGAVLHGDFVARHGYRGFRDAGLALRRQTLDALLLESARGAGAHIREGERVGALLRDSSGRITGVSATSRDGNTMHYSARAVVGADGLNSIVAAQAGLARKPGWPRRLAIVTHFTNVRDVTDRGEMHVERSGYLGIARVTTELANVALVVPRSEARRFGSEPARFLLEWIAACTHLAPRFADAKMQDGAAVTGPFARRVRTTSAPGVALVGDAADFFDPFTGEGIYTALRGGELLAQHLRGYCSGDAEAPLQAYDNARRAEFRDKSIVEQVVAGAVGFAPIINHVASVLARKKDMADLLVGVTGDFVPAREVLSARYIWGLLV